MGGSKNNNRLEANDVEEQLQSVDATITSMKAEYKESYRQHASNNALHAESKGGQARQNDDRAAINSLVARSKNLHNRLKALDAKRLTKKPTAVSKLASFLFGGN